jgi:DNA polymerase-4
VRGRTVTLSIRFADFDTWTGRQETLKSYINRSEEIYRTAAAILDTLDLPQPVRLLGVRLSNLSRLDGQLPLFQEERKSSLMISAMDRVNDRYGDFTLTFATLLGEEKMGSRVISPAWRPSGIRNVSTLS